jgi:hypothetical protein
MDSIIPVVSAVSGGAIAMAGGYINQITGHARQRRAENRTRTANKLEDAARFANRIRKSGLGLRIRALGLPIGAKQTEAVDIANPESDEFTLLLRLYEPSLVAKAQALVDAEMAIGRSVVAQLTAWASEAPSIESYHQFADASQKEVDQLEMVYEAFMKALSDLFSGYRL